MMKAKDGITDEDLYLAFRNLDTENEGRITISNIQSYINRKGDGGDSKRASLLMKEVDTSLSLRQSEREESKDTDVKYSERKEISFNSFRDYFIQSSNLSQLTKESEDNYSHRKLASTMDHRSCLQEDWFDSK